MNCSGKNNKNKTIRSKKVCSAGGAVNGARAAAPSDSSQTNVCSVPQQSLSRGTARCVIFILHKQGRTVWETGDGLTDTCVLD